MFLDTLALILTVALRLFSLYFVLIALFCVKKPERPRPAPPATRFACLIAARNEEAVIGDLVKSLREQQYPDSLYDIYVIPNHCTDRTEERARQAGADVIRCGEPVRCKGDALRQALHSLRDRDYDAFCVFDADNLADRCFLARMNDAFCGGALVAKGALRVKNPRDSWVSGCYGLYFTLFDTFYNRARANCGLSAKLVGTGFAVHRRVFDRLGGWNTDTIAEDAEFSAQCAARGIRISFVPDAVTYDEAPADLATSMRQRRRWCSGVMCVAQRGMGSLLRALGGGGGRYAFDMMVFLSGGYAQALSPVPLLLGAFGCAAQGQTEVFALSLAVGLTAAWLGSIAGAAVLAGLGGYGVGVWRSVAMFPVFMATWLPLQVMSLVRRTQSWEIIRHTRSMSVGELSR